MLDPLDKAIRDYAAAAKGLRPDGVVVIYEDFRSPEDQQKVYAIVHDALLHLREATQRKAKRRK